MAETDRKELILDTFIRLAKRFGIDKTNLQDVARELGISIGTIYQEFGSKELLVRAGLLRLSQYFISSCASVVEQELPPEQLLHNFIVRILTQMNMFITENRGFHQYVKDEGLLGCPRTERSNDFKNDFKHQLLLLISTILKMGVAQGSFKLENIEKNAELIFDAFYIFFVQLIESDRNLEDILTDVRMMCDLLLQGIKKR